MNDTTIKPKEKAPDRLSTWLANHYMVLVNALVGFYLIMAVSPAVFMKIGWTGPANLIYTIYSPLCHQLAFRSFFLFGEQYYYPRSLAGVPGVRTYEEISGKTDLDLTEARNFVGNEQTGYKMALCQRDIGIYGSILLFGILFSVTGRKAHPVKWYLWIAVGMIPIALDGFSQFPSLARGIELPAWVPVRESTPAFRLITGCLFGAMTAWFIFPVIEEAMRDNRKYLAGKNKNSHPQTADEFHQ